MSETTGNTHPPFAEALADELALLQKQAAGLEGVIRERGASLPPMALARLAVEVDRAAARLGGHAARIGAA